MTRLAEREPELPPICGYPDEAVDMRRLLGNQAGCGGNITSWSDAYRCTVCRMAFHRECAERHFNGCKRTRIHEIEAQLQEAQGYIEGLEREHRRERDQAKDDAQFVLHIATQLHERGWQQEADELRAIAGRIDKWTPPSAI